MNFKLIANSQREPLDGYQGRTRHEEQAGLFECGSFTTNVAKLYETFACTPKVFDIALLELCSTFSWSSYIPLFSNRKLAGLI